MSTSLLSLASGARLPAALLIAALSAFVTAPGAAAQVAFGSLDAETTTVSLGQLARGESSTATFEFKNGGSGLLEILAYRTSCSCATVTIPDSVAPGETATLEVAIDSFKVRGPTTINVFLTTNNPDNPESIFVVETEVMESLAAHPGAYRYIVYQNFLGDAMVPQTVFAMDHKDIKILKIESPYEFLHVGEPRIAVDDELVGGFNGEQWYFEARLDSAPPIGALVGNVIVHTDHPTQPRIPIPISGFVRPLVAMTPQTLAFGTFVVPKNGTYLEIHLQQFAEEEMGFEKIECDIDGIEIEAHDIVAGREWKLRAVASPNLQPGSFKGTVTLHTDHERQKTIVVPISGTVGTAGEASEG